MKKNQVLILIIIISCLIGFCYETDIQIDYNNNKFSTIEDVNKNKFDMSLFVFDVDSTQRLEQKFMRGEFEFYIFELKKVFEKHSKLLISITHLPTNDRVYIESEECYPDTKIEVAERMCTEAEKWLEEKCKLYKFQIEKEKDSIENENLIIKDDIGNYTEYYKNFQITINDSRSELDSNKINITALIWLNKDIVNSFSEECVSDIKDSIVDVLYKKSKEWIEKE